MIGIISCLDVDMTGLIALDSLSELQDDRRLVYQMCPQWEDGVSFYVCCPLADQESRE